MAPPLISELERHFEQLSSQAQRDLLERLSHRVRTARIDSRQNVTEGSLGLRGR
jgi:hypothetical protein